MHHIIYMSQATHEPSPMDLVALLLQCRDNNAGTGLTGALVYGDGHFMQLLEGQQAAVQACYERILRDPRHTNLFKLADKPIAERSFRTWSMAFREVSPGEFDDLVGYASPAQWAQLDFANSSADILLVERMRTLLLGGNKQ